ncbi:NAD(P)/FAD-dependent oxidoreductase [Undibacterium sp. TJN25]|uniref:NAD(P)/FAD-dependent oxidoreductase n=1 Tax=Undibacterium sp. TJN25 TaxID=3413056 RepID=UPI003BEFD023
MNNKEPSSVVILGGGQSGIWAAKTLRDEGYEGEVTLVSEELHAPYERPPLSKALLQQPISTSPQIFDSALLDGLSLTWRKGVRGQSLDLRSKEIVLSDQSTLTYGKLIFCTGGRALRPEVAGMDLPGVYTLRTLDDCVRLHKGLQTAQTICVVGGGWIGLEVASTARTMEKSVVLLERVNGLCTRMLPPELSAYLLELHRLAGVDVRLNSEVSAIGSFGRSLCLNISDGKFLTADLVVFGAGLLANDEVAAEAGLQCDRGILVNHRCVTSDPDVLAAGDVAVAPNRWAGRPIRLESWQNATAQAVIAAKVALGQDVMYDPLPWFWSDQHDINLQIFGWPQSHHRTVRRNLDRKDAHITFLLDGDKVMSAIGVNAARELRMSRRLIESAIAVRDCDLGNPEFKFSAFPTDSA